MVGAGGLVARLAASDRAACGAARRGKIGEAATATSAALALAFFRASAAKGDAESANIAGYVLAILVHLACRKLKQNSLGGF